MLHATIVAWMLHVAGVVVVIAVTCLDTLGW
jgi:hypothetical protein